MKIIFINILFLTSFCLNAQTTLKIAQNAQLKMIGNANLVLKNSNLENNGNFNATNGTVKITGDAASENSTISGTTATEFYNLEIDKSANDAVLGNHITVANHLMLTNGCLDIVDYDVSIGNIANLTNSINAFVRTTGLGNLVREVSNIGIDFPIGNTQLNLLTISNNGTPDNFSVRCEEGVLSNGDSGDLLTENVVNTTWYVSEATEGGGDVNMTATWHANQELSNFDRNNSFIWHYTDGGWQAGTSQAGTGTGPYSLTENNITSFSPFTVASGASLPIGLLNLVALPKGDNVQLEWKTSMERNADYFVVQHCTDVSKFNDIGKVQAMGHSQRTTTYDFLHHQPIEGLNYYRLKQFDKDGKFEYSGIVSVNFVEDKTLAKVKVYPNPTTDILYLEFFDLADVEIKLFDNYGQLIQVFDHPSFIITKDFIPNIYFLRIENKVTNAVKIEQIVIQ